MRITKDQLKALRSKYALSNMKEYLDTSMTYNPKGIYTQATAHYKSFLSFRRSAQLILLGDGAITVKWCGMWLCIEADGYTHS